jgi:DNA-directed RNA polymerase subunit beta
MPNAQDPVVQHQIMKQNVADSIAAQFPFEGKQNKLVLNKIWTEDKPIDFETMKEARLNDSTIAAPVYGDVSLLDKNGKEMSRTKKMRLAQVPVPTPHGTFLVNGTEYQIAQQERLKPGVYARTTASGQLQAQVNLAKGMNFSVGLNPERRKLEAKFGTANVGLYDLMKIMGTSDGELQKAWGKEILDANQVSKEKVNQSAAKIHKVLFRRDHSNGTAPDTAEGMQKELRDYFSDTEIDSKTTERTLGKGFKKVTADLLGRTSEKLLNISRGDEEVDNRNALIFKSFHGPEDQLKIKLDHWKTKGPIANTVKWKVDQKDDVRKVINNKTFDRGVEEFFTSSSLSNATEQNNPLSIIGEATKSTVLGEGGISSSRAVPDDARNLESTSLGFMDMVHTPESDRVGITLHTGVDTIREGNILKTAVRERATNRARHIDPEEMFDSIVAFPDQFTGNKAKSSEVKGIYQGRMGTFKASDVKFILDRAQGMFDMSTNMIPFLASTQPTRGLTASKQSEQSVSLIGREAPLVQIATGKGKTFEQEVGEQYSWRAPIDGVVEEIKDGMMVIKNGRKTEKLVLPNNYPLNQKTFIHAEMKVNVGDKIKKGDLLADTNHTKDGVLALGRNLSVAYMPYKGLNFEDAVVISESAAKKMTSEHLHHKDVGIDENSSTDLKKFRAHTPGIISDKHAENLTADGVIKVGTRVEPGDVLVAHLREEAITPEDNMMSRLMKSRARPWKDRSVTWDNDFGGVVTDIAKTGSKIKVYVKTEEPMREGDKIVGRHGNKGIVSKIIPDVDMIKDEAGNPIDLIMDPHGVPSRINAGQILETAAGKAARKKGEIFEVENFKGDISNWLGNVKDYLKDAGVKDKEDVFDPTTNRTIPGILVGDQYITKLKHQVERKFGARNITGHDINLQPKGGKYGAQSLDHLTLYTMLAHDARANIREMNSSIKSEKNDELWLRLQSGMSLPKPQPTFAWDKFKGMMTGMGVKVIHEGNKMGLTPLTDRDIENISRGAIENPTRVVGRGDMRPEKGGLFDPEITGGLSGDRWSHIDLAEPLPNPVLEKGVLSLTGLKKKDFDSLISGEKYINDKGELM